MVVVDNQAGMQAGIYGPDFTQTPNIVLVDNFTLLQPSTKSKKKIEKDMSSIEIYNQNW